MIRHVGTGSVRFILVETRRRIVGPYCTQCGRLLNPQQRRACQCHKPYGRRPPQAGLDAKEEHA